MEATFKLYHNNPNIKTLEEFCQVQGVHFDNDNSNVPDKYKLENFFEDNKSDILRQMNDDDKLTYIEEQGLNKPVSELTTDDLKIDMTIPCPMTLVILKRLVTYSLVTKNSVFQEQVFDINAFQDEWIQKTLDNHNQMYCAEYERNQVRCGVLGFFKTLYYNKLEAADNKITGDIFQMKNNFLNISKFILSINTSVNQQGGTFSLSLPHIPFYHKWERNDGGVPYFRDDNNNDTLAKNMELELFSEGVYNISGNQDYPVVKSPIDSMDYFNWLISPNDLIFISYDELPEDITNDDNIVARDGSDTEQAVNYDMIGLVDSVTLIRDSQGNLTVNVTGKDLMKLLSDDSSIYFPNSSVVNQGNFFDNTEGALVNGDVAGATTVNGAAATTGTMMRMPSARSIMAFAQECNGFTIDYIIKVVVAELTNMQICPSEIFNAWGDRKTKFSHLTPKNKEEGEQ